MRRDAEKAPDAMTAQEVCELLDITRMTLHRRIKANKLTPLPKAPGHERHYRLLFRRSDVEALLSKSPTPPPPPSAS